MAWFHPRSLLDKSYEIGLFFKGVDGIFELVGGILLLLVSPNAIDRLVRFLTQNELSQDPHDFVATHILRYGHQLAHGHSGFAVAFLLVHGITKVGIVFCLLKSWFWAYPTSLAVLGLFVVYQVYQMIIQPTFGMAFLTIVDVVIIVLIYLEWQKVRHGKHPSVVGM